MNDQFLKQQTRLEVLFNATLTAAYATLGLSMFVLDRWHWPGRQSVFEEPCGKS